MTEAYDGRQVVGMDLHRRRSVLVRMTADGKRLETARITNGGPNMPAYARTLTPVQVRVLVAFLATRGASGEQ